MRIFKACLMITKRHAGSLIIYFVVFLALCIAMTNFSVDKYTPDFTAQKPEFTIINRDKETPLTEALRNYLREQGTEVVLEDRKEILQDATFFHASEYILIIPSGFHAALFTSQPSALQTIMTPDSAQGYYLDQLVNQYWNLVRTYQKAGLGRDAQEIADAISQDLSLAAQVEKKSFGSGKPVEDIVAVYSRMQAYIQLVLIILAVSTILLTFQRPDLRMRNLCGPIRPRSIVLQRLLFGAVVSVIAWLLLCLLSMLVYSPQLAGVDIRIIGLIHLNSFVYMIVCLALAMVAGSFTKSFNGQNSLSNILSLGLCFLGGIFVPLEMFSDAMLAVAKFTPTYWYSRALSGICSLSLWDAQTLEPIFQAFLFQLGFAAAFFCIFLVVHKYHNGAENSFGSVRTELKT